MAIYVERPPNALGNSRSRTFDGADRWEVEDGCLILWKAREQRIAVIPPGDWLLAEVVAATA